jgi:hypothetical protein
MSQTSFIQTESKCALDVASHTVNSSLCRQNMGVGVTGRDLFNLNAVRHKFGPFNNPALVSKAE